MKGQPNVSYICSRYYRAPELMFGATEYACSVDMWSIGTIMVELLLGHLPFQGQDSTQQHLVEIMKLLGTPTDRELKAMRATCSVDELPKLKAYPWERVFPAGTPPRAMDLARKLLCYDPSQRLTASQALQHPFLQDAEFLLQGRSMPTAPDAAKEFQAQLVGCFDQYVAARNGAMLGLLPAFESAVSGLLHDDPTTVQGAVVSEVGALLKECERAEHQAFSELQRKVLSSALGGRSGGGGNANANGGEPSASGSASSGAAEVAALQSALQQQGGGAEAERLRHQAQAAREEAATLRAQLDELQAQLAARGDPSASAATAGDASSGGQEAPGSVQAAPPSAGRRAHPRLAGDAQGTASPVVARQSICDGDSASVASAEGSASRRAAGRMHGMSSLAEDELGQLTPLGAASARQGAVEQGAAAGQQDSS